MKPPAHPSRRRWFWLGLCLVLAVVVELMAWVGCRLLTAKGIFYQPPSATEAAKYLARHHPVLGWPASEEFKVRRAPESERRTPRLPLVSLYGDSFTYGSEVSDDEAWGNQLAAKLDARVDIYGVRGYGTDQAFLRFQLNTNDPARVIVLGLVTENAMRNVNQLRNLIYADASVGLKPRFILGPESRLQLIPLPVVDEPALRSLLVHPGRHLTHEFYLPETGRGVGESGFPFVLSLMSSARHFSLGPRLRREPWHADFLRADHPSQALPITLAIVREFEAVCRARGRTPLVLILPTCRDLQHFRRTGRWVHAPLADALASDKQVLDVCQAFARTNLATCESLYVAPSRHMNAAGNRLLAEMVAARIAELMPKSK